MNFNCLIPELRVFDLEKSKKFYTEILGFKVEYSRHDFAMLVLGDCQIMLQQLTLPSREGSWNVSDDMKYPLGRGINLQIILPDISKIYYSLKNNNYKIFIDLMVSDYQENDINNHVLEFLVQDPDGYLLRFQQDVEDWRFYGDKEESDKLFDLVMSGMKVATSCLNDDLVENNFSILTNWDKTRRVIIHTTKQYVASFDEVSQEHAFKEGEGDRSLKYWRKVHENIFKNQLMLENKVFDKKCLVKCEEFEVTKIL